VKIPSLEDYISFCQLFVMIVIAKSVACVHSVYELYCAMTLTFQALGQVHVNPVSICLCEIANPGFAPLSDVVIGLRGMYCDIDAT
jgi:hypothetical protein